MLLPNTKPFHLAALTASIVLFACGGGSEIPAETVPDPVVTATPTAPAASTPTPAPSPTPSPQPTPTPNPTACTAAPIGSTGYSLVFKGCTVANVADYYDKTECVRDNATGLIWEGKPTSGFRRNTDQYTNIDTRTKKQIWINATTQRIPTFDELDASTNSEGYPKVVFGLCGFTNWRIPTKFELEGLIKPNQNPKIDNLWFPNTGTSGFYWTSTADLETYNGTGVNFFDGTTSTGFRTLLNYVRLVRQ